MRVVERSAGVAVEEILFAAAYAGLVPTVSELARIPVSGEHGPALRGVVQQAAAEIADLHRRGDLASARALCEVASDLLAPSAIRTFRGNESDHATPIVGAAMTKRSNR